LENITLIESYIKICKTMVSFFNFYFCNGVQIYRLMNATTLLSMDMGNSCPKAMRIRLTKENIWALKGQVTLSKALISNHCTTGGMPPLRFRPGKQHHASYIMFMYHAKEGVLSLSWVQSILAWMRNNVSFESGLFGNKVEIGGLPISLHLRKLVSADHQ
jgi:hypothetical protein